MSKKRSIQRVLGMCCKSESDVNSVVHRRGGKDQSKREGDGCTVEIDCKWASE